MQTSSVVLSLAAGGVLCSTTLGQTLQVIFSEIAGDPTSMVPAGAGLGDGEALFEGFDRPYRSPDGTAWIMSADTDLATSEDEIIVIGTGMAGTPQVREGTAFGSPVPGELVGLINRNMSLADGGQYAFATNTNGPTTSDELIVLFDGADWIIAAQEGGAVPTMPTEAYGTTLDSPFVLNDGVTVGFRAPSTSGALASDFDDFLILGAGVVAQEGTTIPDGQAGGATETWDAFDLRDFYGSADGKRFIAGGDLTGDTASDDVAVVDNTVVLQEGSTIAGSSFTSPVETVVEIAMSANGDWFARGDNDDQQDWVVRNGDVIAATGEPIAIGGSESYSDTEFSAAFFWMAGNAGGDYVIGGTTSNPDLLADAVLVLNGRTVVARQGDPVDLDGNGLYDDDLFLNVFNNDDGFLTDDGVLYFMATVMNGLAEDLGQAFMRYDLSGLTRCLGDIVPEPSDGAVDFQDLLTVLAAWGPCPQPCETGCLGDIDGDCQVAFGDLLTVLAAFGDCP